MLFSVWLLVSLTYLITWYVYNRRKLRWAMPPPPPHPGDLHFICFVYKHGPRGRETDRRVIDSCIVKYSTVRGFWYQRWGYGLCECRVILYNSIVLSAIRNELTDELGDKKVDHHERVMHEQQLQQQDLSNDTRETRHSHARRRHRAPLPVNYIDIDRSWQRPKCTATED